MSFPQKHVKFCRKKRSENFGQFMPLQFDEIFYDDIPALANSISCLSDKKNHGKLLTFLILNFKKIKFYENDCKITNESFSAIFWGPPISKGCSGMIT